MSKSSRFLYDYYLKEGSEPKKVGIKLMIPIQVNSGLETKLAIEVAKKYDVQFEKYNLNTGKWDEPIILIPVFVVKLQDNKNSKDDIQEYKEMLSKAVYYLQKVFQKYHDDMVSKYLTES